MIDGPTENGCTCRFLNAGQVCISCRARAEAEHKCRKCGVGLFEGDETARHKCSSCYYNNQ